MSDPISDPPWHDGSPDSLAKCMAAVVTLVLAIIMFISLGFLTGCPLSRQYRESASIQRNDDSR